MPSAALPITAVVGDRLAFRLPDPSGRVTGVTLDEDGVLPPPVPGFHQVDDGWELTVPLPPVDRIEYLYSVDSSIDGEPSHTITDPTNPRRVGGAFGDKSWLALPGYHEPDWLGRPVTPGDEAPISLDTAIGPVTGSLWSPADAAADEPLPLLVSHDGPEMASFGGLADFAAAMVAAQRLPRLRLALLAPGQGQRNRRYAANPDYAAALAGQIVPTLLARHPSPVAPVLVGPSLGGLAALHAEWLHPGTFAGLFLMSGSFFTPNLDGMESGFEFWDRITAFVASVSEATSTASHAAVTLVAGTAEENLHNNRRMAQALCRLGLDVGWGQVRDGHNYTCWRDLLDPHLTELLTRAWRLEPH